MRKRVRNPFAEAALAVLVIAIAAGIYFQRHEARQVDAKTAALASGFAQIDAQHAAENFELEVDLAQKEAAMVRDGAHFPAARLAQDIDTLTRARAEVATNPEARAEADRDLRTLRYARPARGTK